MKSLTAVIAAVFITACAVALDSQASPESSGQERGIVALDQSLKDLTNPFTIMCVAARPEDADYGTLAFYRKSLGARAVILLATGGEGDGAPITSTADFSLPLMAARAAGADVYTLGLRDFGHSKSSEEVLRVWGRDDALRRVVRALRFVRPDCIITSHDAATGHGQQRALAQLTLEAMDAAANPSRFPLPEIDVWQTRRLFVKTDEGSAQVTINLDQTDTARGLLYSNIALNALKTLAVRPATSEKRIYYKLARSHGEDKFHRGGLLTDGIAVSPKVRQSIAPPRVGELSLAEAIAMRPQLIEAMTEKLVEKQAEGSAREIRERYGAEAHRVVRFIEKLERAIALAMGLRLDMEISDQTVVSGQLLDLRLKFINGSDRILPVVFHTPKSLPSADGKIEYQSSETVSVALGETHSHDVRYEVPQGAHTEASLKTEEEKFYPVGSLPEIDIDFSGRRIAAAVEVGLGQATLILAAQKSFRIAPVVEIETLPFAFVKDWEKAREMEITVLLRNRAPGALAGALWVVPMALTQEDYQPTPVSFSREDEQVRVKLKLTLPVMKPPLSPDILMEFRRLRPAPPDALASARMIVKSSEAEFDDGLRVGWFGSESWPMLALDALGVAGERLNLDRVPVIDSVSGQDRFSSELDRFSTVIVGERAFENLDERISRCLLEYARRGGNLVVFYQQDRDWEFKTLAPYPIKLSKDIIAGERATVKIIDPSHPLMKAPNEIREKDFDGWVVNRAIFPATEWSSEYAALLETSVAGQEAMRGGLLVARVGAGTFVYVGYDPGRQLLSPNAGAYRLFANLISLQKTIREQANK